MQTQELLSQQECSQRIGSDPLSYPISLVKMAWAYNDALSKCPFLGVESRERDEAWAAGDKFWSAFVSYRQGK
jgi:hypothetical protein